MQGSTKCMNFSPDTRAYRKEKLTFAGNLKAKELANKQADRLLAAWQEQGRGLGPAYVLEEDKLRGNLALIQSVAEQAGVEIILAFKAYALWKTFPIFREYIRATTASSLAEARLAVERFGSKAHTYSPAYTELEFDEIARCSSHVTFNSWGQYDRFHERALRVNPEVSMGVRINPEYSEVGTLLYNPCAPGTRFGLTDTQMPDMLPPDVQGFHCHCHCESDAETFQRTLAHVEKRFAKWFGQIEWMNFGGGHLMTRKGYNVPLLIEILRDFRTRHPHLQLILEPGSAFAWQTGVLVAQVVDIVENHGIRTAILNVSFTCHMPDCLEMPYHPAVRGAEVVAGDDLRPHVYRLGGNSCLSGDFMSSWCFDHELRVGENIVFEDMLHYTTVKTCTFNGITHPAIALLHSDGTLETLRRFDYGDYESRMD